MRNLLRLPLRNASVAASLGFLAVLSPVRALDPADWKTRQPLPVDRAGVHKLALPPSTLGLARPDLEDLRLLDPEGHEVPFAFTSLAPAIPVTLRPPAAFRANLTDSTTQLLIETGTTTPLEFLTLTAPAPNFLKAVRLEISTDGASWETLVDRAALFRQFGAEQLRFELSRRSASHLRVTIDDTRTRPVPFTGATLQLAGTASPELTSPIPVRVLRREEFAGESVLTLDLGGAHVPLASLEFATPEPLFARPLTFTVSELRDDTAVERTLGSGPIWRVAAEGLPATARLDVPVYFSGPSRELRVHVANGDSPPLAIDAVTARQRPRWLVFRAATPGTYAFLAGHPQIPAPRYDLATLAAALRNAAPSELVPGTAEPNPAYRAREALADTPLRGAALDVAPWAFRKTVRLASPGVQQLELDLDVLAHAQSGLADLRLIRDGTQLPYLLERPNLTRWATLTFTPANDPKRPRLSRWEITLPRAGLPVTRLTLTASTALFQRHLRFFEKPVDARGESVERTLAETNWSKTPGEDRALTVQLATPPATATLFLETDNGDNPPLTLASARVAYPVVRVLFKPEPSDTPLALCYGNRAATTPRYDLALVAGRLLAAEKSAAVLGAEEKFGADRSASDLLGRLRGGPLFWAVLSLVIVGLLVVVAKLLPQPPAA